MNPTDEQALRVLDTAHGLHLSAVYGEGFPYREIEQISALQAIVRGLVDLNQTVGWYDLERLVDETALRIYGCAK